MSNVMDLAWMKIAAKEIGVKEVPGNGDNKRVLAYHRDGAPKLRAQSDSVPWCAAFTGWVLKQFGAPITGEAAARSYLNWGYAIPKFRPGCVVVMKRGDSSWQGHVGFGVSDTIPGFFKMLGGNQSDAVNIQTFSKSKVLGYRWCKQFDEIAPNSLIKG
jgi:uncharacterized protein (TIGR02594 family)